MTENRNHRRYLVKLDESRSESVHRLIFARVASQWCRLPGLEI